MRVVFTGGPGTGKSTIIDELKRIGYKIITEPARDIISHYEKYSPELHPKLSKENREKFQLAIEQRTYSDFKNNEYGFFDRSIIDEIGYRKRLGIKISPELNKFCKENRYDVVFFFPFWKEIYKNDSVRHETPVEAELVSRHILNAYKEYGYDPYIVPKLDEKMRMEYIISNLMSHK